MRHNNFFSDFVRRAAVVLGVMLTTTATAWAEDHVKSSIDVCKGGLGEVCITGWVYDTQRKSYETAENYGISVRAVVSTAPIIITMTIMMSLSQKAMIWNTWSDPT